MLRNYGGLSIFPVCLLLLTSYMTRSAIIILHSKLWYWCNKSVKTMERVNILDAILFILFFFSLLKTLAFPSTFFFLSYHYPIGHRKDISNGMFQFHDISFIIQSVRSSFFYRVQFYIYRIRVLVMLQFMLQESMVHHHAQRYDYGRRVEEAISTTNINNSLQITWNEFRQRNFLIGEKCQLWKLVHISQFYIRYESHNGLKLYTDKIQVYIQMNEDKSIVYEQCLEKIWIFSSS